MSAVGCHVMQEFPSKAVLFLRLSVLVQFCFSVSGVSCIQEETENLAKVAKTVQGLGMCIRERDSDCDMTRLL